MTTSAGKIFKFKKEGETCITCWKPRAVVGEYDCYVCRAKQFKKKS